MGIRAPDYKTLPGGQTRHLLRRLYYRYDFKAFGVPNEISSSPKHGINNMKYPPFANESLSSSIAIEIIDHGSWLIELIETG